MIVLNFFGPPGCGKSTGAARVFTCLKSNNINAELVTEFCKDQVYEENKAVFEDQVYILGQQNFRLSRIDKKVEIAVTDSPILLSIFYDKNSPDSFKPFVKDLFDTYNNINIWVERDKPYNPSGRFQTEEESDALSIEMKKKLSELGIDFDFKIKGNLNEYDQLGEEIVALIKSKAKLKIRPNPDKEEFVKIYKKVKENEGYCPCRIKKTEDTKCMCKEFRDQTEEGFCHCGLYQKVKLDTEQNL